MEASAGIGGSEAAAGVKPSRLHVSSSRMHATSSRVSESESVRDDLGMPNNTRNYKNIEDTSFDDVLFARDIRYVYDMRDIYVSTQKNNETSVS